uniref:Fatty-acid amide hydrolase 1 n=1 Tax=Neovison vison TaxID=452646 RepID=A0A8C7BU15_NEOVI
MQAWWAPVGQHVLGWSLVGLLRAGVSRVRDEHRMALHMDWSESVIDLCPSSPQEPSLDPKAILELPLERLAQKLQNDELSLESVLCSYLEEALKVHKEVNCLTDFLGECEEQLQALKKLQKTERGLLYGVPISLKDTYDCKGHDSTCGLAQFLEKPAAKDGVIVEVLKAQGAIPFVKTNIPQTLFSFYCSNPIYGQTLHPLNLKKTPGGSSGGEGVILAQRGSILGMGTDSAGSIRVPASFCGVCGLRTTGYRLRYLVLVQGEGETQPMAGPMARDVESLALCLRALLSEDMHRLDPTVPFMPFREEVYSSNQLLRIGYCESDGFTQPTPSMARAMRLTSRLLQDAGHQVGSQTGEHAGLDTCLWFLSEGDIVDPCVKTTVNLLRLPGPLKGFLARILKYIVSVDLRWGRHSGGEKPREKKDSEWGPEYKQEFIAKWRSLDLDVLLTPVLAPAFFTGYSNMTLDVSSYSSPYNVLNFPAGVVPVTTVTLQDEEELAFYKGYYKDTSDKLQGSIGLPVAVQCVALPWEEELCLRFMKEVETLAKNHREPE